MKQHLNTVFVTTQGSYVAREGENVVVRLDNDVRLRVPVHMLDGIVCFGRVGTSASLMGLCGRRGVGLSFLTERGRFRARVVGPTTGNVLLRRAQYRAADEPSLTAELARAIVIAKILNARTLVQRTYRRRRDEAGRRALKSAITHLKGIVEQLSSTADVDVARGYEGEAARAYFGSFNELIGARKGFRFEGRSRRPPLDPVNALLSFVYTLLLHDVISALETVGLDPAVGFLHRERPGRPSLALDLMEEQRAFLADRLVLSLINRQQVRPEGFRIQESGAVEMDDDTRKTVLVAYQARKQETLRHPFLDETISVGLLWHIQARLLARYLRGDLDAYPPFLWRG
ncbi:MAG: type I-C CRISPR-associated endonuclease Cas1 [Acidobacteria bacterium]|nr:MAG: type I-C CRISPR-associated endonuclease Cas1 [Acidobacteriota bacterium]